MKNTRPLSLLARIMSLLARGKDFGLGPAVQCKIYALNWVNTYRW